MSICGAFLSPSGDKRKQNCGRAEPTNGFACHRDMDGVNSTLPKAKAANAEQYGPDVLCASWTPSVAGATDHVSEHRESVNDTAAAEAEAFLPRFYLAQQG